MASPLTVSNPLCKCPNDRGRRLLGGGGSDGAGAGGGGGGSGFGPPGSVFFTAEELEEFDLGPDGLVFLEFTPDPGCHVEPARPVAAEPRLAG